MDSLISAAGRALSAGDPLGALNRIALREDPPALALRGIAMAQLGDFARAKLLLRRAARGFGAKESMARARCVVAEAEIALASRDLDWPVKALAAARDTLEAHGDAVNAAHARYLDIRRLLLLGRLDDAEAALGELDPTRLPPALRTVHDLAAAGIAMRRLHIKAANGALTRAARAAAQANIPALSAEVTSATQLLSIPAARLISSSQEKPLRLADVETLFATDAIVVDACRHAVRSHQTVVALARRPVLFALARSLAEAWPNDVSRDALVATAFGGKEADESHRARLRVEIGRLRTMLKKLCDVVATKQGFVLSPHGRRKIVVLARPVEDAHGAILAFLADGECWSSSALALALGTSQRTVQRALDSLAADGKAQFIGHGRARRWMMPPLPGITTTLLLPTALPGG
ncbi:MAG: hypothetical protein VW600_01225 [Ferrovibrio sp.]